MSMEKNRIKPTKSGRNLRMSYSRKKEVVEMPNLIEVQRDSYQWFLDEGLSEAFADISPITDYSGKLSLEFTNFVLDVEGAKYTIEECKERDATYAAPLKGLSQLIHTIELVQERLNPKLEIEGVVFTMYDARTNLSLQVVENVKGYLHQNIYKTIIPRNVRLAEAPSHGLPINLYDTRSAGAESYRMLAQEVLHKGEEEWQ